MPLPDLRQRSGFLFLGLAVGHIILISAQVSSRSGVPLLEAAVFGAFGEVQRGTAVVVRGARGVWEGYVALRGVRGENQSLRQQVRDLQVALQRQRSLAGESQNLRRLMDLRDRSQLPLRAAEIIGTSATVDFRTVTIDRGTSDGVATDMAVVSYEGAVGRVVMPSRHVAKVQLLVDRNAAAAVIVERSRAQGIAMGSGESLLRLEYVAPSADIVEGDVLVTSGIDGVFPAGFIVGRVERVERTGGTFKAIRVRPAVDFSGLEQVLVVLAAPGGPEAAAAAGREGPR